MSRLRPTINRLLSECLTGVLPHQRPSYHRLLHFLDVNLIFLKEWLRDGECFERVLSAVWGAAVEALSDIMQASIKAKMPPGHFANLYGAFRVLLNFFYGDQV